MQTLRAIFGGFSPIARVAVLSIVVLVGVTGWKINNIFSPPPVSVAAVEAAAAPPDLSAEEQQVLMLLGLATSSDPSAPATSDPIAMISPMIQGEILGSYVAMLDRGDYTEDDLREAGERIAPYVKAAITYKTYSIADFSTVEDSSSARTAQYRDDLQAALSPLSDIPEAEFETYGRYVETSDPQYLSQLSSAAVKYHNAAKSAAAVVVPREAVNYHRELLNSLEQFGTVLEKLVAHTEDPLASAALLRTFVEAESKVYTSFDSMHAYYARKSI